MNWSNDLKLEQQRRQTAQLVPGGGVGTVGID